MFRLYVFDLDGTLVDSLRDLTESVNALLVAGGARPLDDQAIGRMVGEGAATLVSRAFAASGMPPPVDALARFLAIYDTRLLNHTRPYDGIPEALQAIGARTALAVLTNKPLAATRRILAGVDLAQYFDEDAVVGGDGPFPRKPHPEGLRQLAVHAGAVPADTLLVGDSAIDWKTARNAGTRLCMARYGFGFEGFAESDLTADDRVIDAPRELLQL